MKYLYFILLLLLATQISFTQETDSLVNTQTDSLLVTRNYDEKGTIIDMIPLADKDTLKVTRWYGDWWFGASFVVPYTNYMGDFYAPINYGIAVNPMFNPEYKFQPGDGFGYGFGLMAEYNPVNSRHGALLRLNYTNRTIYSETEIISKTDERRYFINSSIDYLEFRPAYRFDLNPYGFYAFVGPGLDLPLGQESELNQKFVNSGDIKDFRKFKYDETKLRFFVHAGIGVDLFLVDVGGTRFRLAPFFAADFGSPIIGTQNTGVSESSVNVVSARLGLSVKFGSDQRKSERLKFDPNYRGPEYDIAGIENDVNLSGNLRDTTLNSSDIAYYKKPEPEVEEIEDPIVEPEEVEEEETVNLETNRLQFFEFPTPAATDVTPRLKSYLNSVAKYMKDNPSSEIRIVGHSDNMGTPEQNQRRSVQRKDKVVNYLLSKGIDRFRILDRGEGDRRPIADSKTAEGRRKNRRVEITIVQ